MSNETENPAPGPAAGAVTPLAEHTRRILLVGIFAYARALGTKDVLEASAG